MVTHGYGEYSGYGSMRALIRHTVRKGSIVIYPRWQTDLVTPCPGPFDIEPCVRSALNGVRGALAHLRARPKRRVQPKLGRTSYFGFSFGGIITANLANRYRALQLPRPRAIFLDDPHDGGFAELGFNEPALDDSLAGIPRAVKLQCHSSEKGVISEPNTANGSCNAVFPKLRHIPSKNKSLVLVHADTHGEPDLPAPHGVCAAGDSPAPGFGKPNAYDWNFCWKVWDALRSCALSGADCRSALGKTPQHRSLGRWSDGVPVTPLKVQDSSPIRP